MSVGKFKVINVYENIDLLLKEKEEFQDEFNKLLEILKLKVFDSVYAKYNLLSLFNNKNSLLKTLTGDNFIEISKKLNTIDENIYYQFKILFAELPKSDKDILKKIKYIFKNYSDKKNIKDIKLFLSEKKEFLKKYYLKIIIFIGAISFISYFIINRELNYFPVLDGFSSVALFGTLFMITLSMFSIIYLLPFIHVLFLFFGSDIIILRQNQKYLIILCVFSIFLFIVYFILFLYEKTEYLLNGFMALLPLILTLSWYIFERGKKYNKEIIFSIIINYFLFFLSYVLAFFTLYIRLEINEYTEIIVCIGIIILSTVFIVLAVLSRDYFFFRLIFWTSVSLNFGFLFLINGTIIKISNYGNIMYKNIVLDTNALGFLPEEICMIDKTSNDFVVISYEKSKRALVKECGKERINNIKANQILFISDKNSSVVDTKHLKNIEFLRGEMHYQKNKYSHDLNASATTRSITYVSTNDDNKTIVLHNVKALSTIGKFYLLKTTQGTIFEIDSKFIGSRTMNYQD
ncbi:hypothetical protein G6W40_02905 [Campylobacter concisus]|uniref:hypothetical protein n=4 Tax=Campylobacter concisus TaxID=199 RepID=UPI00188461E4|nr:hypothetical protein [Campylobacter concisus]MBE9869358.1 hypothetical protein [Campylobacter concisus]